MSPLLDDLRALKPDDPLLVARSCFPEGQAYLGWNEQWEKRLAATPLDEEADLTSLGLLPAVEHGLLFALARRGHAASRERIVAMNRLAFFATAYARYGSSLGCASTFAGVERVWPQPAWNEAVIAAVLSPDVEKMVLQVPQLEPLIPLVRDADLLAFLAKRTWVDAAHTQWLEARLRVGAGEVWLALDACCTAAAERLARGDSAWVPDDAKLAIEVAGVALRAARATIPPAWAPLVETLARDDDACVIPILACLPESEREARVLASLDGPAWSPRFSLVEAYPTPSVLAALCERALREDGWRYHRPFIALLPLAVDTLLAQLPPPAAFATFLRADVTRAFAVAEALLSARSPRAFAHLAIFLSLPTTPEPWQRLAPWVARQWGRWPTSLLEQSFAACLGGALGAQDAPARWVEIVEGSARTNAARALAARWARELPAASPLQIRMAWVAAEEPPELAAARPEAGEERDGAHPVFDWAEAHTGTESPSYDVPTPAHPAFAWAAVRWMGAEAPMTRLVRAAPPGLTAAAEAWLGHRTDLLEAGEEPPPWLQPQLCAALRASNERALVQRVLIAAGPTALRESLEAVAVPWLLARGDASSVLTTIIAARKSKKGRKVPTKGLESALISVHAHAERGRPRPAGAPWSAWGTVEKVEPACERAVTSIQLWGTRRWVTRAGAAAQLEVLGEAERWLLDDDEAVSVRDDDGPGVRIAPGDGFHTVCALPARRVLTLSAAHTMAHGVQLWNADSGAALQHAPIDDMPLALVAAGLERVLIVGADSVWLWPIGQKKALRWRAPQGAAWAAIGSDHVAVGCEDRTLHFLRWSNDKLKAEAAYGDGWAIPGMAGSPEGRFLAQPDRDGVKVWADGALTGWLTWPESPDPGRAEVPDADGWVVVVGETAVLGRGRRVEAWSMGDRVRHATWEAPHELTARAVDRNGAWLGDAKGAVWWLAPKP